MATETRISIINRAKTRAGRQAQALNLTKVYDAVVQYMSAKYPLIQNQRFTAAAVGSQQYLAANLTTDSPVGAMAAHAHNVTGSTPLLLRAVEKIQYNAVDLEYLEPELFFTFYSASTGTPTVVTLTWMAVNAVTAVYTSNVAGSIIYMYLTPSGTDTVTLSISMVNPKSTGDSYTHVMGEEMDEAIIRGVTGKALEIIGNFEEAVREKIKFEHELKLKAFEKIKGAITFHHPKL